MRRKMFVRRGFTGSEETPHVVILSEAKNLSFFCWAKTKERFFASLGMTKKAYFFHEKFNRAANGHTEPGLSDWPACVRR
jgi:hypothetical protein